MAFWDIPSISIYTHPSVLTNTPFRNTSNAPRWSMGNNPSSFAWLLVSPVAPSAINSYVPASILAGHLVRHIQKSFGGGLLVDAYMYGLASVLHCTLFNRKDSSLHPSFNKLLHTMMDHFTDDRPIDGIMQCSKIAMMSPMFILHSIKSAAKHPPQKALREIVSCALRLSAHLSVACLTMHAVQCGRLLRWRKATPFAFMVAGVAIGTLNTSEARGYLVYNYAQGLIWLARKLMV